MKFCFLDLETTGIEPTKDSIIEASFVVIENRKEIARFDKILIPEHTPLTDFVTHLTGITQEEIDKNGQKLNDQKEEIETLISDSIIIGHNIDFDINFLVNHDVAISKNKRIDTHELARILLPQETSFALEVLCQKYGFIHDNAHRAMSDVLACVSLFDLLIEAIYKLPKEFTESIKPFLENHTDWDAKILFLDPIKPTTSVLENFKKNNSKSKEITKTIKFETSSNLTFEKNDQFIRLGDVQKSTDFFIQESKNLTKNNQKSLIVSPKLNFFNSIMKFPTPEVIFDVEKLKIFLEKRKTLNNAETTFYLKCLYRHFLGHRGLTFFDLFFKENNLWKEVSTNLENSLYQNILKEKSKEDILAITPNGFAKFIDLEIFKDRIIFIDEAEKFAKEVLFAPTKTLSLQPYLEHVDPEIAKQTHFFIAHFCRDIIEIKQGRKIGPFPEKVLFEGDEIFPNIVDEMQSFLSTEDFEIISNILKNPPPKSVRWCLYYPNSGALNFNLWQPEKWRKIKQSLKGFKKVLGYRGHKELPNIEFFNLFLGTEKCPITEIPELEIKREKIIPDRLVSVKSPDFNNFSASKILELFKSQEDNMSVYFSSLEALRKVFDVLIKETENMENIFICGERVMGGNGKMLDKMAQHKDHKILFLFQNMTDPKLQEYNFKSLIIQKFPFDPPEPLLDKIQDLLTQKGVNYFGLWVMTQVGANLDQKINLFSQVEKVYILDARENAGWGKDILKNIF